MTHFVVLIPVRFLDARLHLLRSYQKYRRSVACSTDYIRNSRYYACVCPVNIESTMPVSFSFLFLDPANGETAHREKLAKRELWIRESGVQTRRYFLSPSKRFSTVLFLLIFFSFPSCLYFSKVLTEVACKLEKRANAIPWLVLSSCR